jgi:hypothetical protein
MDHDFYNCEDTIDFPFIVSYIYSFAIMHLGAFCIGNAPTLIVIDLRSVATGLTLVAIGSRRAAIRWSSYNWFVPTLQRVRFVVFSSVEMQLV